MAKTIAHRELRNNSSAILREVGAGETFTITNHGVPVAVLAPIAATIGSALPPGTRFRPPLSTGRFADLPRHTSSLTSQEILDELRGDR
jgi:prevent-host-death family protein